MNILITGHHSLGNRGCEALLRSTVAMVRSRHPSARFWVPSSNPAADSQQWPDAADHGVTYIEPPRSTPYLRSWARTCRLAPFVARGPWPPVHPPTSWRPVLKDVELALAIGGDNYTLDYGLESLGLHVGLNHWLIQQACPVILWGASVGPFDRATPYKRAIRQSMTKHLRRLKAISVRESLTAAHLEGLFGTPPVNPAAGSWPVIRAVADPAFQLQACPSDLGPHWPEGQAPVLGLNISSLVLRTAGPGAHAAADDAPLDVEGLARFIRQRCESGEFRFVLIPHVTSRNANGHLVHNISARSDDAVLLDQLMQRLGDLKGVRRVPCWDAARLKYAIANCDLFIGARTHSVIAALSSAVPTVALAYSVKAHGIHRDLFGHELGVLPMQRLSVRALGGALAQLAQRSAQERAHLLRILPLWRSKAMQAMELLPNPGSALDCHSPSPSV